MFKVPNQHRLRNHPSLGSDDSIGNNGFFVIPHFKISDYIIACQSSDGEGWEHVSASVRHTKREPHRCPNWEEMCFIKDLFWDEHDSVVQFHPKKSEYVNIHPYVLHLWKPTTMEVILPPTKFV
jgi:hypothetical protein